MKHVFVILVTLLLPFVALPASQQKVRRQPNRPPVIRSFISSSLIVEVCSFTNSVTPNPVVVLFVDACDPDGDTLAYEYSSKEGTISGTGNSANWNLIDLPRGPHEVQVTVTDGKGGKAATVLSVTTVDASSCTPPPPPCPRVTVSIP